MEPEVPATLPSLPGLPPPPPSSAPCWSDVLRKTPPPKPKEAISSRVFANCKSNKGISVAVVDANAIIHGDKLMLNADKFVSVREVLEEVRDPVSRQRLAFLPFHVETMDPSSDAIKKVVKFAKETGDLQTLSDVDIKLIALAYMLEVQMHGTNHLRESPPPLRMVDVRNLPEVNMPGWSSNVPNLAEWEALEQATDVNSNEASRILPLKDLNFNIISAPGTASEPQEQEDGDHLPCKPRRFMRLPKKEIKIDGKKMVAEGIDASQGKDTEGVNDWRPAVSRSTHRRYLKRQARRALSEAPEERSQPDLEASTVAVIAECDDIFSDGGSDCTVTALYRNSTGTHFAKETINSGDLDEGNVGEYDISSGLKQMILHSDDSNCLKEEKGVDISCADAAGESVEFGMQEDSLSVHIVAEGDEVERCRRELDRIHLSGETDGSIDASQEDDLSSEQSWSLRSLSDSSVACVTSDFAMQNVILQIGLRLLVPGGMQIRQLHRWVLKCHACNKVTTEIGRIFCPKCGNGGTLRKASVTVDDNGIVLAAHRPRITLRGTKFSLPLPQGGREAITKNLILREDQLPHKVLYPKSKKKNNKQDKDFISEDDFFSHLGAKKTSLKPPIGRAVAVYTGKRNPNDNHFSRRKL